jgi:hypothetical protein
VKGRFVSIRKTTIFLNITLFSMLKTTGFYEEPGKSGDLIHTLPKSHLAQNAVDGQFDAVEKKAPRHSASPESRG